MPLCTPHYLRIIDKKSEQSGIAHMSTRNQEPMNCWNWRNPWFILHPSVERGSTEKLLKGREHYSTRRIRIFWKDVIIENKQAIEMANIYSGILKQYDGNFCVSYFQ